MPVNRKKQRVHYKFKIQEYDQKWKTTHSSNKKQLRNFIKMDTHVFSCFDTRTNSQEKPSTWPDENGLALSTLDSLQSLFILSVIVLKNLTAPLQVSSRSESRHSKRWNLKFKTTKHQCPTSSLGFMAATDDGGSKIGKRS